MDITQIKPLTEKSLDVFCAIFDFCNGEADITCPVSTYPTACLRALERRGLIQWDTERVKGKTKRWAALTELGAYYGCEGLALALVPEASKTRNRLWIKVQFNMDNPEYITAYQIAGELARKRLLAPVMRDWLLIHAEFGDKNTETFAKAYPAIHKLMTEAKQDDLLKRIEAALQNAPQSAATPPVRDLAQAQGLRPIAAAKAIETPNFDDEDMEFEITADTSNTANTNFIKSIFALQE